MHVEPITAKLMQGPLDGDTFLLTPNGSIMPPVQLRYLSRSYFQGVEAGAWLIYEHDGVLEWSHEGDAIYTYVGAEKILSGKWAD